MKTSALLVFLLAASFLSVAQSTAELENMVQEKIQAQDYKYALVLIEKAIALNDTNVGYYLAKAEIEHKLYGSSQALKTIFKAISLNRKDSEPYSRAGRLYVSRNVTDSAIYMFNLAIKYAADDTLRNMYLMNRATAKLNTRDFEGARADFEKVLRFEPDNIAALNNIAGVYSGLNMIREAIVSLKRVAVLDPEFNSPNVNLGFIYSEMDSLDLALQYFDKALSIEPKNAYIYNNRGYVYYKKGDYATALKNINYSVSISPSNSYAYRNMALVYIATGKKGEACDALRYAESYGFQDNYGDEVNKLIKKHCK